MAAGKTYVPLATQTLANSTTANVTFSAIPATYTDLVLVCNYGIVGSEHLQVQFNGDTATNYSYTDLNGSGTTATSDRGSTSAYSKLSWYPYPASSTLTGVAVAHFMNYANTTTYKTFISRNGGQGTELLVGLWRSTAAINAIKLYPSGSANFLTGSVFTLYGLAAA